MTWRNLDDICNKCDNSITPEEKDLGLCPQCKKFQEDKQKCKTRLHEVMNSFTFNGGGTREVIGEFTDEVCGS